MRVYTNPAAVKDTPTKMAYLWQSRGCDSFHLQHVGRKVLALLCRAVPQGVGGMAGWAHASVRPGGSCAPCAESCALLRLWHRLQAMKGAQCHRTPGVGPAVPQACEQTGAGYLMGGPLWSEALHDPSWVAAVTRIVQVLPLARGPGTPGQGPACTPAAGHCL